MGFLGPLQGISLLRTHPRHRWVCEVASVQELHNVKGRTDHTAILAKAVRLRDGHIGRSQGMDNLILALHLVGRLGQQLAGGFLAENELLAIGGGELVGRVGLTEAKLVNVS